MERFNPSARMKAKLSIEKIFERLRQLVDISKEELNEMDLSDRKESVIIYTYPLM